MHTQTDSKRLDTRNVNSLRVTVKAKEQFGGIIYENDFGNGHPPYRCSLSLRLPVWCQRGDTPRLGSRLITYRPTNLSKWWCYKHTSVDQTPIPCVPWIKTKIEGVKSGCSSGLKLDRFGMICKATPAVGTLAC